MDSGHRVSFEVATGFAPDVLDSDVKGAMLGATSLTHSSSESTRNRRQYSSQVRSTADRSWCRKALAKSRSNSSSNASARAGESLSPSASISASAILRNRLASLSFHWLNIRPQINEHKRIVAAAFTPIRDISVLKIASDRAPHQSPAERSYFRRSATPPVWFTRAVFGSDLGSTLNASSRVQLAQSAPSRRLHRSAAGLAQKMMKVPQRATSLPFAFRRGVG